MSSSSNNYNSSDINYSVNSLKKEQRFSEVIKGICPEYKKNGDLSEKLLYKCEYCGRYFCEKHLKPKLALSMNVLHEKFDDPKLEELIEKEWRKENAHPDFVYTKEFFAKLQAEKERETEKFNAVLDVLCKRRKKEEAEVREVGLDSDTMMPTPPRYENITMESTPIKIKDRGSDLGMLLLLFLLVLAVFFVYLYISRGI